MGGGGGDDYSGLESRFPDIFSVGSKFEKILSMTASEWLVSLAGYKIYRITELEVKESRKLLEGWCTL